MKLIPRLAALFGYDAVESSGRRKSVAGRSRSEDRELTPRQRVQLSSSTRDLRRNFAIAAWAIRKHLDYVSSFSFQADTGDDGLDDAIEELMYWYAQPANCDVAGRMSLGRVVRICEALRTIDGDVFLNFVADGRVQGIEGDRVTDPRDELPVGEGLRWEHGVLVTEAGRPLGYAVHKRTGGGGEGLEYERFLSAAYCYHHHYIDRFDQVRGVAPMAPAINSLRDVYENFDYALAKAKVSQLFALAISREAADEIGNIEPETAAAEDGAAAEENQEPRYKIDFGRGPILLDLDGGDKANILESATPSNQFQDFTASMIGVSLKALDIPYSFYDESHTNYSGQRQAWIQYDDSAKTKREDNRNLLNWTTERRLALFVRDGELQLPRGMTFEHVRRHCNWISHGIPWIDPLKEITADVAAIKAGQLGPETACRSRGQDVYKMIDERARVEEYARNKGVVLEYMLPPIPPPDQEETPPGKAQAAKAKQTTKTR